MASERAPERAPFRVLLLDPDAERGARAASAIEACGFESAAVDRLVSALDQSSISGAAILVVQRDAARIEGGAGPAPPALLDAGQIGRLRGACGATLVIAWDGGGAAGAPASPPPAWADERIPDLDSLIARIARHAAAAAAGGPPGEEAERVRRALDEAGSAAHEMSQPLTTILARVELLLAKTSETDPNRRALSIILQEAERLARTVQRFQAVLSFRRRP